MTYRIKRVDAEDEEIAAVLRDIHDETFGNEAPQLTASDFERGWWWIAFDLDGSRDIAGFCGITPTWGDPARIAYLKRAAVRRGHRGAGLQRRFVRVREALARRAGFETIVTDTTDNPPSANNLIACGYRIYEPPEPWGFKQTIYWTKDL